MNKMKIRSWGVVGPLAISFGIVIIIYALLGSFFSFSLGGGEPPPTSSVLKKEIIALLLGSAFIKVGSYIRKKDTKIKESSDTHD